MSETGSRSCLNAWLDAEREVNEARAQLRLCINDPQRRSDLQRALWRANEAGDKAARCFDALMETLSARLVAASRRPPLLTDWLQRP